MAQRDIYKDWLKNTQDDVQTYAELMSINDDDESVNDRFYKDLQFGTGGLRGVMAAGTNRINRYSIARASAGLAVFLLKDYDGPASPSVAIAYDSRRNSALYAKTAAQVLSGYGVRVYLYDSLRPTPQLSFTIRHLACDAGIVITASHNPKQYNGFKVYGRDGGQITSLMANQILKEIQSLDYFSPLKRRIREDLIEIIGSQIDEVYYREVLNLMSSLSLHSSTGIRLVYTPVHGSGNVPVQEVLHRMGFEQVFVVESQQQPDGDFPTVVSPNPENHEVFEHAIELASRVGADVIFATDPDCDRVGVAVADKDGRYQLLNGNQIGALLVNYITSVKNSVTPRDAVIKTIVTSSLGAKIASSFGATVVETLTGFKYIGEKIKEFESDGNHDFLFGYEESYGYLAGTFVRDKDAVIASALIALMAADAKSRNMTLLDILEHLYQKFGYYFDHLESFEYHGMSGAKKIVDSVNRFRDVDLIKSHFSGVRFIEDFDQQLRYDLKLNLTGTIDLPKENVIKIIFDDQSWVAIRPSGTEPKLKIYYSVLAEEYLLLNDKYKKITEVVHCILSL